MSGFHIAIREARRHERRYIESSSGRPLASDHCVVLWLNLRMVGWGDDYGTFHPLAEPAAALTEAGEKLLEAAQEFWGATQ